MTMNRAAAAAATRFTPPPAERFGPLPLPHELRRDLVRFLATMRTVVHKRALEVGPDAAPAAVLASFDLESREWTPGGRATTRAILSAGVAEAVHRGATEYLEPGGLTDVA